MWGFHFENVVMTDMGYQNYGNSDVCQILHMTILTSMLSSITYIQYIIVTFPCDCWVSDMLPNLLLHDGELSWSLLATGRHFFSESPCHQLSNFGYCGIKYWADKQLEHSNIFVLKIAMAYEVPSV